MDVTDAPGMQGTVHINSCVRRQQGGGGRAQGGEVAVAHAHCIPLGGRRREKSVRRHALWNHAVCGESVRRCAVGMACYPLAWCQHNRGCGVNRKVVNQFRHFRPIKSLEVPPAILLIATSAATTFAPASSGLTLVGITGHASTRLFFARGYPPRTWRWIKLPVWLHRRLVWGTVRNGVGFGRRKHRCQPTGRLQS